MPPLLHYLLLLLLLLSSILLPGARGAASGRPEIYPHQEEITVGVGKPLNLTCRAAQPVAWCTHYNFTDEKNYEEVYEDWHDKPYTSILTIDALNISHVGYFSCVFNTSENKEKNLNCDVKDPSVTSLYLYVKDPDHLLSTQKHMVLQVAVGEPIVLPCKPNFPGVKMTLFKNYFEYKTEYNPRRGFTITQATVKKNAGNYHCVGAYHGKTEDQILILSVDALTKKPNQPSVDVQGAWQEDSRDDPVVYYVREGSNVNLTCIYHFNNVPNELKLEWAQNSLNQSGLHRIIRQVDHLLNYRSRYYEINNALPQDSENYTCWAKVYEKYSEPASLHIQVVDRNAAYLTTSIFHPNVTEVEEDLPVQWEILFLAHPEPVFHWKKHGRLLFDSTTSTSRDQFRNYEMNVTLQEASLSLYLHHPTLADNGRYTLEASLPGTNITTTTTMFLMIHGKPQNVRIKSVNNKQMFKEGDPFSLTCTAEGYPKPTLSLHFTPYRPDTTVDPTQGTRVYNELREEGGVGEDEENSPVVRNVHWMGVAEEPGMYRCKAVNELGMDGSPHKVFLVTDGESPLAISLKLEIGGEGKGVDEAVTVVEGDDLKLTCRANKVSVKAPLTWTLNGVLLDTTVKETWGMEVTERKTRLSLISTVRARILQRAGDKFSIACRDKTGNQTSTVFHVQEMVAPTWMGGLPGKDYDKNKNENVTLSCPANGIPPPKVVWKKGDRTLVENNRLKMRNNHQLSFQILLSMDDGTYTCEVSNRAGSLAASFKVVVHDPEDQKTTIVLVVVGVLIAALVMISMFYCRKIYQARKETLNLQLREQKMFMEGDPSSLNPELSLEQQADLLPYNTKYEVSRDSIIFDKLLGAGAFGRVYSATVLNLLPGEARSCVAVKMIKSRTDDAQLKALRSEVKIMIHIGRHTNIVNLLGACSKDLASKRELLLLVEYCKHGNILDYMRHRRREFVNQINNEDKIDPSFCEARPRHRSNSSSRSHASRLRYAHLNFHQDNVFYGADQASDGATAASSNLLSPRGTDGDDGSRFFRARTASTSSANHHVASDNSVVTSETSGGTTDGYLSHHLLNGGSQAPLCSTDLLGWAYQIAKGMEYLAFKKVLHGDLAARNVLLAEDNIVKISDFGLAKDIYKNQNYKKNSNGLVPVKWMAVECLRDGVFSTQSDVWSFGVVLWEIFTLGQIPYSCTDFDESFIVKLEKGTRLEQPRYATYGLYYLMLQCWDTEPMQRPSFTGLEANLGEMLGEAQRQNYLQLTEPEQQETSSSDFLDRLASQDYAAKVRQTTPPLDEEGYEMPFSPGVAPQATASDEASRFTFRQKEYLRGAGEEDSSSPYVPMSADRTDDHTVFDFDNETVACIMGRSDKQENDGHDIYLKMDKIPQQSPKTDASDGVPKEHEGSPRRVILKSFPSQQSHRGHHPELTKHDSGVYSPTILQTQTNPGYMAMGALLPTDDDNYINTEAREAKSQVYANCGADSRVKARNYLADGKYGTEYANLLPQDSRHDRTESETSSGISSIMGGSLTLETETDRLNSEPILEEAIAV